MTIMENTTLIKITFTFSLLGILLLILISQTLKPIEIQTNSKINLNQYVKITGEITDEKTYGDFSILNLQDKSGKIQVTCNCKKMIH